MTGEEIIAAWEKWIAAKGQLLVSGPLQGATAEAKLRIAFLDGIEAAESIWRDVPGEKVMP